MRVFPIHLPHYQQSAPGYCLPACARMVLAGIGVIRHESELSRILTTDDVGTPSFAITKLSVIAVVVDYRFWSIAQISATLSAGYPVIAFVQAGFLDHWEVDAAHAVVIIGMEVDQRFWIYDPILSTGPTAVSWDGMLAAWFEFAYRGATLQRKKRFSFLDWVRKVVARDRY